MKTIRPAVVGVALALSAVSASAEATPARQVKLEIRSQVLRDALIEWGRQTGYQIFFSSTDLTRQFIAPAIDESLDPQAALERLLSGTPLTFEWLDERTVGVVERAKSNVTKTHWIKQSDGQVLRTPIALTDDGATGETRVAQVDSSNTKGERATQKSDEPERNARRGTLEEIIVSAQKREERLQDVPISITALSGEDLDHSTVTGVTEALRRVPGVAVVVPRSGGTQLTVRGVTASAISNSGASPISYYLDSIPFGLVRNAVVPDANAYDFERVEVLRGPQGTLYGASAQNGVVSVFTKDANPSAFELKTRASAYTTKGGDESYRGDLAVNVPIIDGKLAARAVIGYQDLGGWLDRPNKENANHGEIENLRLKINAQPSDDLSVGLTVWSSRSDARGTPASDNAGRQGALHDEPVETDFDAYGLKASYDFDSFTVRSMTSYLEYSNDSFLDLVVLNFPNLMFEAYFESEVVSEELIFNSTADGPWRWTAGGMYRRGEDLRQTINHINGVAQRPAQDQTDQSTSFAVFGELTRAFFDGRLELTGGLRYFEDEVEARENSQAQNLPLIRSESKFDALSPRVILTWRPDEALTVYASYAEGFRSGFDQVGPVKRTAPNFPPAEADELTNYELGAKGSFADGRVNVEAAVYYIDWQDVQQTVSVRLPSAVITTVTATVNGESASGLGVDLGLTTKLGGLTAGINGSWNDLTVDGPIFSVFPGNGNVVRLFAEGDRLNWSPEYTLGAFADYEFPLGGSGWEGAFAAYVTHASPVSVRTITGFGPVEFPGGHMTISGASLSVRSREHWVVTAFVDNLNNEHDPVSFDQGAPTWSPRVRPRTMGLQVEYQF